MNKISIILPYKENFSPTYAGAVSLHVEHISQNSIYKKNIQVFGNTKYKKKFKSNYTNITFNRLFLSSNQKKYIKKFIEIEKFNPSSLIEIHNRPLYLKQLTEKLNRKFVFHYHNDPLTMNGSRFPKERIFMINNCEKIIFCSNWVKKRFFAVFVKLPVLQSISKASNCLVSNGLILFILTQALAIDEPYFLFSIFCLNIPTC